MIREFYVCNFDIVPYVEEAVARQISTIAEITLAIATNANVISVVPSMIAPTAHECVRPATPPPH